MRQNITNGRRSSSNGQVERAIRTALQPDQPQFWPGCFLEQEGHLWRIVVRLWPATLTRSDDGVVFGAPPGLCTEVCSMYDVGSLLHCTL